MMDPEKGIGCLDLMAKWQMDFLWIPVVIIPLSIVLEVMDFWRLRQPNAREENAREENAEEENENAIKVDEREK